MAVVRCPHCNEPISVQKPTGGTAKYDYDIALALLKFGAGQSEVAEVMGVTPQTISALRHNNRHRLRTKRTLMR